MTAPRRFGAEDAWRSWVRNNPALDSIRCGLSLTDSDLWVHRFRSNCDRVGTREVQHLMLVEVKTRCTNVPAAQADTYRVIDAILRSGDGRKFALPTPDGSPIRVVRSWGVHVWRMSGDCPTDSEWIRWDSRVIDVEKLEAVLRFDVSPDTLRPHSDRRHHAPSLAAQLQPRLRRQR